ncbi:MAG TPA: hypothetical protein VKS01_10525, partial [Bryobacteraceae bacterium]|nr:hypothetical protein [Bryobacteraceae bacterium]
MSKVRSCTSSAAIAILVAAGLPVLGQTYRAPRAPDGHADLNGIWQALNEANFDLQAHMAQPAMAVRPGPYGPVPAAGVLALGAVGSVPPGVGVVEGGVIPYKPEALATKKQNQQDWLNRDPEIKCYLPGVPRATYMPYPFQIMQSASAISLVYEFDGATRNIFMKDPGPALADSWMGWNVG